MIPSHASLPLQEIERRLAEADIEVRIFRNLNMFSMVQGWRPSSP